MKDKNNFATSIDSHIYEIDINAKNNWKSSLNFTGIVINDNITNLHIQYKGREYVFDLEKALTMLCKELKK